MTQLTDSLNPPAGLTRRQLLAIGWTLAAVLAAGESVGAVLSFAYPHLEPGSFGGRLAIGTPSEIARSLSDAKARPIETFKNTGRFYVSRTEDGLLALYRKCVHLGCIVPWNDAEDQFHCPCHGSLYNRKGEVLGGPAPRPLDLFAISIENGDLTVDTGQPIQRKTYAASQAFPLATPQNP